MNLNLKEKDLINDLLLCQKKISSDYNTFASEVDHTNLKQDVLTILRDEHEVESIIYEEMKNRGWYQTKTVSDQEIRSAQEQFNEMDIRAKV